MLTDKITDDRIKLAELILTAPEARLALIEALYPEYFFNGPIVGSLEFTSDVNTSYLKWKDDYNISLSWIREFPSIEIYNNYMRYCIEHRLIGMSKTLFFNTIENDFNI